MSNLDKWLDDNRWKLDTIEVADLRAAFARDVAEALKPSHNKQSMPNIDDDFYRFVRDGNNPKSY